MAALFCKKKIDAKYAFIDLELFFFDLFSMIRGEKELVLSC